MCFKAPSLTRQLDQRNAKIKAYILLKGTQRHFEPFKLVTGHCVHGRLQLTFHLDLLELASFDSLQDFYTK